MIGQLLEAAFYLAMAGAATALTWHRPMRLTGAALMLWSALSSLTFFLFPFGAVVIREILMATMMSTIAWTLWHEGEARVSHQIIILCCLANVALCGVITILGETDRDARLMFAIGVNISFWIMCLSVIYPGLKDHVARWVRSIDDMRTRDSATPDFDFLIRKIDERK